MKWSEILLRNMSYIISMCIVLHNLCIVNKEGIQDDWIIKDENKLATRATEEELWEGSELREEKAEFADVKKKILARDDAPIPDKVNDVDTYLFLSREIEMANDLMREAIVMHNLLAKKLWQSKTWYKSDILYMNIHNDSNIMEK